jgi:hypothetical protein
VRGPPKKIVTFYYYRFFLCQKKPIFSLFVTSPAGAHGGNRLSTPSRAEFILTAETACAAKPVQALAPAYSPALDKAV